MQHQLCLTLPPGWCKYDDDSRPRPSTSLEWNDVMRGLKTFGRWILTGRPYVNQAEADRRALVCTRCYLNVDVSGCSGCQKLVEDVVVDKHSKYDSSLRACAVCKCFLRAKIHFHLSDLEKDEDSRLQEMYPDFCWLKKGGENYKPLDKPGVQAENQ